MTMDPEVEREYNFALIDNKKTITTKNATGEVIELPQSSYFKVGGERGSRVCWECALLQIADKACRPLFS